jgi:hypothetical protein
MASWGTSPPDSLRSNAIACRTHRNNADGNSLNFVENIREEDIQIGAREATGV